MNIEGMHQTCRGDAIVATGHPKVKSIFKIVYMETTWVHSTASHLPPGSNTVRQKAVLKIIHTYTHTTHIYTVEPLPPKRRPGGNMYFLERFALTSSHSYKLFCKIPPVPISLTPYLRNIFSQPFLTFNWDSFLLLRKKKSMSLKMYN